MPLISEGKKALQRLGRDSALVVSALNQLWRVLSSPLTLILITLYLSLELQGYWYAFLGVCALSMFADLGFTSILLQFASHEMKSLRIDRGVAVIKTAADSASLGRLSSLYRFASKWVILSSCIVFPIIFVVGLALFGKKTASFDWLVPWTVFVCASAVSFYQQAMLSFFEGCHQVARVQFIRLVCSVVTMATLVVSLASGLGLLSLALGTLATFLAVWVFSSRSYRHFRSQMRQVGTPDSTKWAKEFLRLLWRYVLTWSSGYLLLQIYVPLAFDRFGPQYAGQVGLTLSLVMAGLNISNVWIISAYPKINALVSEENWQALDRLYRRRTLAGLVTLLAGYTVFVLVVWLFQSGTPILQRLLPLLPTTMLVSCWVLQYFVNAMAMYVRAHKVEPVVALAVVSSLVGTGLTLFVVTTLDKEWMFIGLLAVQVFLLLPYFKQYRHFRTVVHTASRTERQI